MLNEITRFTKIITHTDLDGQSCPAVLKSYINMYGYEDDIMDIYYVSVQDAKDFVLNAIAVLDKSETLFITDLNILDDEVVKIIDEATENGKVVYFVDHHKDSNINRPWNLSDTESNISATEAFAKVLFEESEMNDSIKEFIELVTLRDTWQWNKLGIKNGAKANRLNSLCFMYPKGIYFTIDMSRRLTSNSEIITDSEMSLILEEEERHNNYCIERASTVVVKLLSINGISYKYAKVEVDSNKYSSDTANIIYSNRDIDFVAVYVKDTEAYALRTNKDDVDVSLIAKSFGGGGHAKAAGCKPVIDIF